MKTIDHKASQRSALASTLSKPARSSYAKVPYLERPQLLTGHSRVHNVLGHEEPTPPGCHANKRNTGSGGALSLRSGMHVLIGASQGLDPHVHTSMHSWETYRIDEEPCGRAERHSPGPERRGESTAIGPSFLTAHMGPMRHRSQWRTFQPSLRLLTGAIGLFFDIEHDAGDQLPIARTSAPPPQRPDV
jgi:hypothetical protein